MNKNKRILVTGSNGFIGDNVLTLLSTKYFVNSQARNEKSIICKNHHHFIIDINKKSDWGSCLCNVDVIVHNAGVAHTDSDCFHEVNVNGTINLAMQAVKSGVKRLIFISSIGVLGKSTNNKTIFNEQDDTFPYSPYTKSKQEAEIALLKIAQETDLEIVIIRPVLVYGADAPGNFGKLINLVKKVPILPFALCNNKRSLISVYNLADFISLCIEHPKAKNEIFCISDGVDISIKELTNEIAKGLGQNLIQFPIPKIIFSLLGFMVRKRNQIEQLVGDLQVDSNKAMTLLEWKPPFTMANTLNHLNKNKRI